MELRVKTTLGNVINTILIIADYTAKMELLKGDVKMAINVINGMRHISAEVQQLT